MRALYWQLYGLQSIQAEWVWSVSERWKSISLTGLNRGVKYWMQEPSLLKAMFLLGYAICAIIEVLWYTTLERLHASIKKGICCLLRHPNNLVTLTHSFLLSNLIHLLSLYCLFKFGYLAKQRLVCMCSTQNVLGDPQVSSNKLDNVVGSLSVSCATVVDFFSACWLYQN